MSKITKLAVVSATSDKELMSVELGQDTDKGKIKEIGCGHIGEWFEVYVGFEGSCDFKEIFFSPQHIHYFCDRAK